MRTLRISDRLDFGDDRLARFVGALGTYWSALQAGHAAARAYQELTARGIPHEAAVQQIFNDHFSGR